MFRIKAEVTRLVQPVAIEGELLIRSSAVRIRHGLPTIPRVQAPKKTSMARIGTLLDSSARLIRYGSPSEAVMPRDKSISF
jgi:hypothetical protein